MIVASYTVHDVVYLLHAYIHASKQIFSFPDNIKVQYLCTSTNYHYKVQSTKYFESTINRRKKRKESWKSDENDPKSQSRGPTHLASAMHGKWRWRTTQELGQISPPHPMM